MKFDTPRFAAALGADEDKGAGRLWIGFVRPHVTAEAGGPWDATLIGRLACIVAAAWRGGVACVDGGAPREKSMFAVGPPLSWSGPSFAGRPTMLPVVSSTTLQLVRVWRRLYPRERSVPSPVRSSPRHSVPLPARMRC